jgi:MoaA/NifB/PqqE/SkfB family radical SAM enzyme
VSEEIMTESYKRVFDRNLQAFFADAAHISLHDPRMAIFVARATRHQARAAQVRRGWEAVGVHVPAFMIISVTHRCNLACQGCYARAQHPTAEVEMTADKLRGVIAEADTLGVSIMMLAGGEPLTRPEVLDIAGEHPRVIFPLFTNGMLIDDTVVRHLRRHRNIVPVLSIEGRQNETDLRRGSGVHERALEMMARLHRAGVFFGTSLTVTRQNYDLVTGRPFLQRMLDTGCRLFFFVDYVPVQPGTECLTLTQEQRDDEATRLAAYRDELPGLFVAFPGDEEMYGGCLAAGRGFVHVSPSGRLEPCPFAPYSDVSLQDVSLRQALRSRFLEAIRTSDEHLGETNGGCALWERRQWVQSLLHTATTDALPVPLDSAAVADH